MDLEEVQARRAARARERRIRARRRRAALGGLIVVIVLIAVAVALAANNGGSGTHKRLASAGAHHRDRHHRRATFHPGSTVTGKATGHPGTTPVPILMYHVINPPPTGAPFPGLYVQSSEFAAQMQALKAAGWHAVTLDQVEAYWKHGVPLGPGKPFVLTFDNGYESQYTNALPVLQKLHWAADENIQLTGLPPSQGGLTKRQVEALIDAGWELDTQGISHADLVSLSPSELSDQVVSARRTLRREYHVPVNWFCYPSGHYDAAVMAEVKAAGFIGSTTVIPGWASPSSDPYRLPRLRVLGGTSPSELLSEIASIRSDAAPPASYGT
jgi:peptidoglycan/xylan/chitin deacetylase (PgdA/CDA1 family)